MEPLVVAALYKFTALPDYADLQDPLKHICNKNGVKGTLLLAEEGINGTIAGPRAGIDSVLAHLQAIPGLNDLDWKESFATDMPFHRLKVRLKKEIVTIGDRSVDPTQTVGTYVEPENWNDIITHPDVVVIDTRNDYETAIGTFEGALDPETTAFHDFPKWVQTNLDPAKHKKIAMFCTGGIRCEKASSYMKAEGFQDVYHLKGGILKYLETIPAEQSLWHGECFVFDQRVSVTHGLAEGSHKMCYGCRRPLSPEHLKDPLYVAGVQCPLCAAERSETQKQGAAERQKQVDLAKRRGENHIGS